VLVGNEKIIQKELEKYTYPKELLEIVHAPEIVEMWDNRWNQHELNLTIPCAIRN
jgi:fatty acid/phospholipid biosynthesis enzyme